MSHRIKKHELKSQNHTLPKELIRNQIIAVVNFPKKKISTIMSECLALGGVGDNKEITLVFPEIKIKNSSRIG